MNTIGGEKTEKKTLWLSDPLNGSNSISHPNLQKNAFPVFPFFFRFFPSILYSILQNTINQTRMS